VNWWSCVILILAVRFFEKHYNYVLYDHQGKLALSLCVSWIVKTKKRPILFFERNENVQNSDSSSHNSYVWHLILLYCQIICLDKYTSTFMWDESTESHAYWFESSCYHCCYNGLALSVHTRRKHQYNIATNSAVSSQRDVQPAAAFESAPAADIFRPSWATPV